MPSSPLDRRLAAGLLAALLVGAPLAAGAVVLLDRRASLPALAAGLGILTAALGAAAWAVTRRLVARLREVELGIELISTVNPAHRLDVRAGDEVERLAAEVNRMADRLAEVRGGLEREVSRATSALSEERAGLSAALDALGEGVVVATADGRVSLANRAARELLAGGASLLGGSLFDLVDREKVALFLERMRNRSRAEERFTLHPPGGRVLDTVMTPFSHGERQIGFVLVLSDVTETARSEEERGRLLAEAVRELRGPIAAIRSLSESLLAGGAPPGDAEQRVLEAIHGGALRLSAAVREMDESPRLGVATPPRHFEEVAPADLAGMALRRLGPAAAGVDRLEVGTAAGLPSLKAEPSTLSDALAHLVRTVLARRAEGGSAWLRPAGRGRVVQIDVGAEGTGSARELEALLDPPGPAAGPGRPDVRQVIRRHAGEVWAYGGEGRLGFRMTLPAATPDPGPPAGGAPRGASFVGAGLASGTAGRADVPDRPDFYDFSLFDRMARELPSGARARPLASLQFVVFDTETTGLRPDEGDRIVSIAAVRVRGGTVRRAETFDALVHPGRRIPAASTAIHGITDAMVAEAPPLSVVIAAFLRFAGESVLVGHQVAFDLRFLALEAERLGEPPLAPAHPVLDTLLLSELVHGPLSGHGLDDVARRLGVPVQGRHSALGDALATAEALVRLIPLLERRGVRTLGDAMEAARSVRGPADPGSLPAASGP